MVKRTDTDEAVEFQGTVTVITSSNPSEYGSGNIELEGALYTDTIRENTDNIGVDLEGITFNDTHFTIPNISPPSNPPLGNSRFYTENTLLKSLDNSGIVTTYQPTNTKGDILTHDGTTQVKLPIGIDGYVLTADPTTSTGIKWAVSTGNGTIRFSLVGSGINNSSFVINYYYGSYFMNAYPFAKSGSSGLFFTSKNTPNKNGHTSGFNVNPSTPSSGILKTKWAPYEEIQLYKNYSEADGNYYVGNNSKYDQTTVNLSGTSWVSLGTDFNVTTGSFCISIFSDNDGPAATFLISKSVQTLNAPSINKISSSPGSGSMLNLRWEAATGIEISKSNNNDDGSYNIIDNFHYSKIVSTSITLTGTSIVNLPRIFFRFYENKSFIMRIYSSILNSPKVIILMSKNLRTLSGSKTLLHSPGDTTSEKLNITWGVNSLLSVYKDNVNYDGNYTIDMTSHE